MDTGKNINVDVGKIVDTYKDDIINAVCKLVSIPSVEGNPLPGKPFGEDVNRALEEALKMADHLGFTTKNIDGYGGYAEFGDGDETMGILVHLDVVPEGTGWTYPPYGGEIHNGRIYGRGAIDDKGPAVGALFAMKAVMDSGIKLNKKIRLIFGVDEESGWEDMEVFFSKEPMPDFGLSPDGNYPLINAEKGILDVELSAKFEDSDCVVLNVDQLEGGNRPNMVPDECRCKIKPNADSDKIFTHLNSFREFSKHDIKAESIESHEILITSKGVSAHGSTPEKGQNAIGQTLAFLSTLGLGSCQMENYILALNNKLGMDTTGENLGINFTDEVLGDLTVNLGTIYIDKNEGRAVINIRYPVTYKEEDIVSKIEESLKDCGVKVKVLSHNAPLYIPEDHFLVKGLKEVYTKVTGEPAQALAIGGGTYARAIENAVAFGALFPGKPELAHQKDEYIEIDDLMLHTKLYAEAIIHFCS